MNGSNMFILTPTFSLSPEIEILDLLVVTDSDTDTSEFESEKLDWSTTTSISFSFSTWSCFLQPPKYLSKFTSLVATTLSLDLSAITHHIK